MKISDATKQDARDLAYLFNLAGEGVPAYLWGQMRENGESALDVGERRAARDEGSFSYTSARICNENDIMMGMIVAYKQEDPYEIETLSEYPEVLQPLVLLESKAPGSWYINAIATSEQFRGKGVATELMRDTEIKAKSCGCSLLSLIVASDNTRAKRLYESMGFGVAASQSIVPCPGCYYQGDWLLMTKAVVR